MQKKENKRGTFRTLFLFCVAVLMTGSVLPIVAADEGITTTPSEKIQIYSLSSSDTNPLDTLKEEMVRNAISQGKEEINLEEATLNAIGFDSTKLGLQNVKLELSASSDVLAATYVEDAAVTIITDTAPIIQLSTDEVELANGSEWNAVNYIEYLYDDSGKLPALKETGEVNTSDDGIYEVTYTVMDLEGKTASESLTVTITTPEPTEEELAAIAAAEAEEELARQRAVELEAATADLAYSVSDGNPYSCGWSNCTFGAWQAVYDNLGIALPRFGNATSWLASAQAAGYATGSVPSAGSVVVYYGHVAYVSAVSADGSSVYLIEGGYNGHYNERWTSATGSASQPTIGYIYL